ncbi:MAG TPA: DoxX family protein [Thermoanaerobaculia bacterium]|nr:DoxX family protein [Thermoanaerobaculia bacterium]
MYAVIGRFTPQAFALLRIVSGLLFMFHGTSKLLGFPGSDHPPMPPLSFPGGISGIIELVCGALITVGLVTGIAAFLASGEMAVAYFMAHAGKGGIWPIQNHGELAVLFCFVFLYFAAHGAGIWSIDSVLRRRTT